MPTFTSPSNSTPLHYLTYTPPSAPHPLTLVFLHGWPMSSRMWEPLLPSLTKTHSFRCVAPDRRGFGRSDWGAGEVSWEVFVGDLVGLLEAEGVGDFVFVGSSMGCTESLLAYQGSEFVRERCKGLVWLAPIMPHPLQTPSYPHSPSASTWATILTGLRANRPAFVSEALPGIFAMQTGNEVHPKVLEHFERIIAEADGVAVERTVGVFNQSSEGAVEWLAGEGVPVLVVHGDSDSGMPAEGSSVIIKGMVPRVELRIYDRAGHGLYLTHKERVIEDLLEFVGKL